MSPLSSVLAIIVTILLAAFFSGSETAVVSCSKVKLRHKVKRGLWRARILESLLSPPDRFFSVVLVGTNVSVIACTAAATALSVSLFGGSGAAIATIVMTPLLLILGEVIPKSAFLYHADQVSIIVAPLLKIFSYILWPLAAPTALIVRTISKVAGSKKRQFDLLNTREELVYLYSRRRGGEAERRERMIINRVFQFGLVRVQELMVPVDNVISFKDTASVEEVIEEANKHTYSRFPITSHQDGRVVGIVSLFDLLGLGGGEGMASVMHTPFLARGNELAKKLLVRMKEEALHMAVVVGDNQEFLGIVTLENILENIVGDIY